MAPIGPPHSERVDLLTEIFVPPLLGRARVRIQQPFLAVDRVRSPEADVGSCPLASTGNRHPTRLSHRRGGRLFSRIRRTTKAGLYAARGIGYWIVMVRELVNRVHAKPIAGVAMRTSNESRKAMSLSPARLSDVVFRCPGLFQ